MPDDIILLDDLLELIDRAEDRGDEEAVEYYQRILKQHYPGKYNQLYEETVPGGEPKAGDVVLQWDTPEGGKRGIRYLGNGKAMMFTLIPDVNGVMVEQSEGQPFDYKASKPGPKYEAIPDEANPNPKEWVRVGPNSFRDKQGNIHYGQHNVTTGAIDWKVIEKPPTPTEEVYPPDDMEFGVTYTDADGFKYRWKIENGVAVRDYLPAYMQPEQPKEPAPLAPGQYRTQAEALAAAGPDAAVDDVLYDQSGFWIVAKKAKTPKPITPYEQAQLEIARQNAATAKTEADRDYWYKISQDIASGQQRATEFSVGQMNRAGDIALETQKEERAASRRAGEAAMSYAQWLQSQENARQAAEREAVREAAAGRRAEQTLAFQREESAANRAEARNQRLAAMAANPAMWIQQNIEAGTSPLVQPWMKGFGVTAPVGSPIDLYQRPEPDFGPSGPGETSTAVTSQLAPADMSVVNALRIQAAGGKGMIPQVTRAGQELTPDEAQAVGNARYAAQMGMNRGFADQPVLNLQAMLPALPRPGGQLLGTLGPVNEEMYYGYEKARTGKSREQQQFELASYNPLRSRTLSVKR